MGREGGREGVNAKRWGETGHRELREGIGVQIRMYKKVCPPPSPEQTARVSGAGEVVKKDTGAH